MVSYLVVSNFLNNKGIVECKISCTNKMFSAIKFINFSNSPMMSSLSTNVIDAM